jgi:hypothetical protein
VLGASELIQNVAHRGPTFVFIFLSVWKPGALAEIFLRKPRDPCVFQRLEVGRVRITVADILNRARIRSRIPSLSGRRLSK